MSDKRRAEIRRALDIADEFAAWADGAPLRGEYREQDQRWAEFLLARKTKGPQP